MSLDLYSMSAAISIRLILQWVHSIGHLHATASETDADVKHGNCAERRCIETDELRLGWNKSPGVHLLQGMRL